MEPTYLEVTYRAARALAAYLYLPRRAGDIVVRTAPTDSGLLVDYARGSRPIGIEITSPSEVTLAAMNKLLRKLGQKPLHRADLAPLRAA